jgi:hypothetical protein
MTEIILKQNKNQSFLKLPPVKAMLIYQYDVANVVQLTSKFHTIYMWFIVHIRTVGFEENK